MTSSTSATNTPQATVAPVRITKQVLRALAPLPDTAMQLLALLDDPRATLRQIAGLAARDVGIAASLLRMANSPIFGMRARVGTIADAVRVIGTVQARLLILACGVAQAGQKELALYGLGAGAFVRHSELVAGLTASLAQQAGYANRGTAYSAGLLHDIGKVPLHGMAHQLGADSPVRAAFAAALDAPEVDLVAVERACFGTDHGAVGRDLLALWALPDELGSLVLWHHGGGERDAPAQTLLACLALANAVAGMVDPAYPASNRAPMPAQPILPVEPVLALASSLLGAYDAS